MSAEGELARAEARNAAMRKCWAEIDEVADEASEPGWDGEGANAVTYDTVNAAKRFMCAIDALPEPCADPDGMLSFEWELDCGGILSASINAAERIYWAALSDKYGRERGTFPLSDLEWGRGEALNFEKWVDRAKEA